MEKTQFILPYNGQVTVNHEYTVNLNAGQALLIDWFPNNDLIIETANKTYYCGSDNCERLPDGRYLIRLEITENLYDLPLKLARGDFIVAGDIVINQKKREYFHADQIDLLPDELVATHKDKVTRVLFSGDKSAIEHYIKK